MSSARKRALVLATAAVVVVGAIVAIAAVGGSNTDSADNAATHAFLRTRLALVRSFMAGLPTGKRRMNSFIAKVCAECPRALRGAPVVRSDGSAGGLTDQGLIALQGLEGLAIAQRSVDAAAVEGFASTLRRLRWHDQRLTALVHTFSEIETEQVKMHAPDLCGEIKAWAVSGYRTVPQDTPEPPEKHRPALRRELAALGCLSLGLPEHAVVTEMRRYEGTGEQPTTRQVELAEFRLNIAALKATIPAELALERALDFRLPPKKHTRHPTHENTSKLPAPYPACSGRPEPLSEPIGS